MKREYEKSALGALWVLLVSAGGFAVDVRSMSGWIILTSLALLPPLVMLRLWNDPAKSMSESINEGRR